MIRHNGFRKSIFNYDLSSVDVKVFFPFLLSQFFRSIPSLRPYFTEYLGECGRVILTEPSGKPLSSYLKASWKDRVDISLKILQMIEDFHDSSDKWLVLILDFGYENFVMTSEGQLKVVNLGGMVIVDKDQTSTSESDFLDF